ncbi:MAG: hypothetical protein CMM01_03865 [Rhodopirellula sp.]|nr:hypothetical protein [Rhodopirellula sp.]
MRQTPLWDRPVSCPGVLSGFLNLVAANDQNGVIFLAGCLSLLVPFFFPWQDADVFLVSVCGCFGLQLQGYHLPSDSVKGLCAPQNSG